MRIITIGFDKGEIIALFRSKVHKVAEAFANDENFKAVYNAKHGGDEDIVDTRISDTLYQTRLGYATALMADYITGQNSVVYNVASGNVPNQRTNNEGNRVDSVTLSLPDTSTATQPMLKDGALEYITEGMLADWTKMTVPNISKQFESTLILAENNFKKIMYNKKAPTP